MDSQMFSEQFAIQLTGIGKSFRVYEKPSHRLWQLLLRDRIRLYKEAEILKDISFSVSKGETVGIVGRNGSGKSTLLSIVCGTLASTKGDLKVEGRIAALLELGAGLNPELTGRENIDLCAQIYGLTNAQVQERKQPIIDFADIGEYIDQPVKTYSSGMFTRLAFAVIAHVDADILVIDEALAVGDAYFVQKCMRHLHAFREKGGTLLFVSHDMGSIMALCDRALWLKSGVVALDGTPKVVAQEYLAELYREQQGQDRVVQPSEQNDGLPASTQEDYADARREFLVNSNVRNDIRVFPFAFSHDFGVGGARISNVSLTDAGGRKLQWLIGGELVKLNVGFVADTAINSLIVGFVVKDKNGQPLFGDNTYLTYLDHPVAVRSGQAGEAMFEFRMPSMPVGAYSIGVALSEGTQKSHVVLEWIHDALVVESQSSSVATGLLGIPMRSISMVVRAEVEGGA